MSIEIRVADMADVDALADLVPHVHELHIAERPEHFQKLHRDRLVLWFMSMLEAPDATVFVAELHGVVVGYLLTNVRTYGENVFLRARRWYELDQVAVSPAARRQGVARLLVERAMAHARELGIEAVELSCWGFNSGAQAAFAKLGFVPKAIRMERAAF